MNSKRKSSEFRGWVDLDPGGGGAFEILLGRRVKHRCLGGPALEGRDHLEVVAHAYRHLPPGCEVTSSSLLWLQVLEGPYALS